MRELVQDGWSVLVRRFSFGRYRCLSGLVKRGGGGNPRVALQSETGFPHNKNIFGSVEVEFEVKTAQEQCGSDTWCKWAPLRSRSNARRQQVGTWRPTRLVVVDFRKLHSHSDAWAAGLSTAKIWRARRRRRDCESPEGLPREGASRKRGVWCLLPPFHVRGEPRTYRDVQLPEGFDLRAALGIGPTILGVTLRNKGLGLRTKECDSRRWLVRFTQQRKPGGS